MARFEIVHRQPQQVAHDVAAQLERDRLAKRQHDPGSQALDHAVEDEDQAEAPEQQAQQIGIALPDRLIDGDLHKERHGERGEL